MELDYESEIRNRNRYMESLEELLDRSGGDNFGCTADVGSQINELEEKVMRIDGWLSSLMPDESYIVWMILVEGTSLTKVTNIYRFLSGSKTLTDDHVMSIYGCAIKKIRMHGDECPDTNMS